MIGLDFKMSLNNRYLSKVVSTALQQKMVFIGGPRQVGKTTMALGILSDGADETHPGYLNWDHPLVPGRLRKMELPIEEPILILDEIHKYKKWRNLVKGIYDTEKSRRKIIVTGSARLDYYRKGGDSLLGRYRYFRLHPFSLMEINPHPTEDDLDRLLRYSGFPEPLMNPDDNLHRIWQRDRMTRVIREDLRDLEMVREISLIEHLVALLPERVGSPLSVNSLREDLEVDHKTVERWLSILENLYLCFRIAPFGASGKGLSKIRSVKKEKKLYLWDWTSIDDVGARFENLVASQLLKYCHWLEDTEGHTMELRYLRDTDKREVDFVVLKGGKPQFAVECKSGEKAVGSALHYFAERTEIPIFYQIHRGTRSFSSGKIAVMPFIEFCRRMNMP